MEKVGIQVFFKGGNILKSMIVAQKDKDPKAKDVIYDIRCGRTVAHLDTLGKQAEP